MPVVLAGCRRCAPSKFRLAISHLIFLLLWLPVAPSHSQLRWNVSLGGLKIGILKIVRIWNRNRYQISKTFLHDVACRDFSRLQTRIQQTKKVFYWDSLSNMIDPEDMSLSIIQNVIKCTESTQKHWHFSIATKEWSSVSHKERLKDNPMKF